ncbi:MAG: DUF3108 domain-containing protein [Bacteroidota bacterium]|nr:DUF3108 domain-containing protein [Bacteroidota bacterium]
MQKKTPLIVIFILSFINVYSQGNIGPKRNYAFQDGENLTYTITYNWFFVWTDVGFVDFEIKETEKFNKKVYHIKGSGKTFPFYDWFFQVRDVYETWIDTETLFPIYYHRDIDEDGYLKDITYKFDTEKNIAYSKVKKRKKPLKIDTLDIPEKTLDVISILFYIRNLDFDKLKKGKKVPYNILLDNEVTEVYFRYKGKEKRKVKGIGHFNCLKFTGSLIAGSVFKGGEDLEVWVTDDNNKIPIWIESPIIVGKIKVRISSFNNLKYPLSSKYQ